MSVGGDGLRLFVPSPSEMLVLGCCPVCRCVVEHELGDEQLAVLVEAGVESLPATMAARIEDLRGRLGGGDSLVAPELSDADASRLRQGLERR